VVATWLAADCGGQFCMAAVGWRGTCRGQRRSRGGLPVAFFLGSGGTAWWFVLYGVELSCATVLMLQSNRCCLRRVREELCGRVGR
jgi:hypothetical protein